MRDPWVMKDPDGSEFRCISPPACRMAMRSTTPDASGLQPLRSDKLDLATPVFTGGWGQLEVPQVFAFGKDWYCLFCMADEHQAGWNRTANGASGTGNHYLIGDSPAGLGGSPTARRSIRLSTDMPRASSITTVFRFLGSRTAAGSNSAAT